MIVPINNGKSIVPIYIPSPVVTTNHGVLEQSSTNGQNDVPTLGAWVALGVFVIFLFVAVAYFIKLLKEFFGDEE